MRRTWGAGAYLALITGATGIGFAPIWVRLSEVGPSATAFYRLVLALPVLWAWLACERRSDPSSPVPDRMDLWGLVAVGAFFAGDLGVWHWSVKLTSVANATLFANFAPIFVALGARWWFGERITWRLCAGMALALSGGVLLARVNLTQTVQHVAGDALGLTTALFYAGYILTLNRMRRNLSSATIMAWSALVSCPLLLLAAWISREPLWPHTLKGWAVLGALALVNQVLGQGLIAYASGHLPAPVLSIGLLLQPVVAGGLAWMWLSEPMGSQQIAGGVVVLVGIGLAGWPRRRG